MCRPGISSLQSRKQSSPYPTFCPPHITSSFFRSYLPLVIMFVCQMLSSPQCLSPVLEFRTLPCPHNSIYLYIRWSLLRTLLPCNEETKQPHGEDWVRIKPLTNSPRWASRQRWYPQLAIWTDWHPGASVNTIWSPRTFLAAHRSSGISCYGLCHQVLVWFVVWAPVNETDCEEKQSLRDKNRMDS